MGSCDMTFLRGARPGKGKGKPEGARLTTTCLYTLKTHRSPAQLASLRTSTTVATGKLPMQQTDRITSPLFQSRSDRYPPTPVRPCSPPSSPDLSEPFLPPAAGQRHPEPEAAGAAPPHPARPHCPAARQEPRHQDRLGGRASSLGRGAVPRPPAEPVGWRQRRSSSLSAPSTGVAASPPSVRKRREERVAAGGGGCSRWA